MTMTHQPADDIATLHERMIERLRAIQAIRTPQVERAMRTVPRQAFAPEHELPDVFDATGVLVTKRDGQGKAVSSVSAPWVQALMLERAGLSEGDRVLEIGSGGYNAALLAEMVGPSGHVVSVDIDPEVISRAHECLAAAGYRDRVELVTADADQVLDREGWDAILVTVGIWDVSPAWVEQLVEGGRLVMPLRVHGFSRIFACTKAGSMLVGAYGEMAGFVSMQGAGAHTRSRYEIAPGVEWASDHPVDHDALATALETPPRSARTGVCMRSKEPFDTLQWWLITNVDSPGILTGSEETLGTRPMMGGKGTIAAWDGHELVYLGLEEVRVQGERRWEWVVCSRSPSGADRLAQEVVELIHTWDGQHRGGPGPALDLYPLDQAPAGALRKRHSALVATWDTPRAVPVVRFADDPDAAEAAKHR